MRLLDGLADSVDPLFALSSGSGGTDICLAAMCVSTSFTPSSVMASARTRERLPICTGPTHHSAIVNLPLVRRDLFQLRQQTLAERRCVSTQRNTHSLEAHSEATESAWDADRGPVFLARGRVTICEFVSAKYALRVTAQRSDVFTRCNFARVAEKLRTSLQCSSPASEPASSRALRPILPLMCNQTLFCSRVNWQRPSRAQSANSKRTSFIERRSRCSPAGEVRLQRVSSRSPSQCRNRQLPPRTCVTQPCEPPLPLLQRTPDVHGAEHDRFQLVEGTLNVDAGCILPAIVVRVQHDFTQRRVKELGLLSFGFWFWVLVPENDLATES